MHVRAIRTDKVLAGTSSIYDLLDQSIASLREGEIVAITSKVVALCENRIADSTDKDMRKLVSQEAEIYLPIVVEDRTFYLSMLYNTLLLTAGIDSSNGNGQLVFLPKNPQKSANEIRQYLAKRFGLRHIGVMITDSSSQPLRRGTIGVALAHSGFLALHDYRGKPDIFGEPLKVSRSNIAAGLAAAAVTIMGEGAEQTPISIISEVPFVTFQDRDPTDEELGDLYVKPEDDLFAPLYANLPWEPRENS